MERTPWGIGEYRSRLTFRRRTLIALVALAPCVPLALTPSASAATATSIGPDGGSVFHLNVYPGLVLATSGDPDLSQDGPRVVWASLDHGQTWRRANARERATRVLPFKDGRVRDPRNPRVFYRLRSAGFDAGTIVQVSSDGGRTFTTRSRRALRKVTGEKIIAFRSGRGTTLLVAASSTAFSIDEPGYPDYSGVYRSINGGTRWVRAKGIRGSVEAVWSTPTRPRTVYAAADVSNSSFLIYKSLNGGASWTRLARIGGSFYVGDVEPTLAISQQNPRRLLFATGRGVHRSVDGGRNWQRVADFEARQVVFHPTRPGDALAASDVGVWASSDGGRTWRFSSAGIRASWVTSLTSDRSGRLYATGEFGPTRIATSSPGGDEWTSIRSPFRLSPPFPGFNDVIPDPATEGRLVMNGDEGQLYRSTDTGQTWRRITTPTELFSIVGDSTGGRIFGVAASGRVWQSTDGGQNWTPRGRVPKLSFLRTTGGALYSLTLFDEPSPVRRSADGGMTWAPISLRGLLWSVVAAPSDPQIVFAITFVDSATADEDELTERLMRSSDGGKTWRLVSERKNERGSLSGIHIDPLDPQHISFGTFGNGVVESRDGGLTHRRITTSPRFVYGVVPDPTDPTIFYATSESEGVWRIDLDDAP